MKKLAIMLSASLLAAAPAMADMWVQMGLTGGGVPYTAKVVSDPTTVNPLDGDAVGVNLLGATFDTFCLEHGEYFTPGSTYRVTIEPYAIAGGPEVPNDGEPNGDLLDNATAFLYDHWLDGLKQFTTVNGLETFSASDFQNAVWYLEDEISAATAGAKAVRLANYASANATGLYNIMVMNLWGYENGQWTQRAQSHVVRMPKPEEPRVPAPGAALIVGLGIGLVGWMKRRIA